MNVSAVVFLLIGLCCLGYTIVIVSYAGVNTAFLWFWVSAALGCFVIFFLLRFIHIHKIEVNKLIKLSLATLVLFGFMVFLIVEGLILKEGNKQPQSEADYVIVLGAQVRGTALSRALKNRLDTAYEYLLDNVSTKVIVSGGQGSGEDISEAKAMEDYLISKGISPERILKEDQSTNTYQNLLYSKALIEEKECTIVIVTSRFHVFRAKSVAKKIGITKAYGLGAPADDIMVISYYVREFFAVVKDKLMGNI